MNFIIITAVLSVANSGLYASSRMLWSLSKDGKGPEFTKKLSKRKIPINALLVTMGVSALSLLTSVVAPKTVYVWLISISGMVLVVVWMSICLSQYFFRKQFIKAGGDVKDLVFRTPLYPFVPLAGFIAFGIVLISLFLSRISGSVFIAESRSWLPATLFIISKSNRRKRQNSLEPSQKHKQVLKKCACSYHQHAHFPS